MVASVTIKRSDSACFCPRHVDTERAPMNTQEFQWDWAARIVEEMFSAAHIRLNDGQFSRLGRYA